MEKPRKFVIDVQGIQVELIECIRDFNIQLQFDRDLIFLAEVMYELDRDNDDAKFRMTYYQIQGTELVIASYGVISEKNPPGHGGEWSSRCEVLNELFGTNYVECCIGRSADKCYLAGYAIDRNDIPLPEGLAWGKSYSTSTHLVVVDPTKELNF